MNLSSARREFHLRYSLWAESESIREIDAGFPILRTFKCGLAWKTFKFLQGLDRAGQLSFARAAVRQYFVRATASVNDALSKSEEGILAKYWNFNPGISDIASEVAAHRRLGKTIRFTSKRNLRAAIVKNFLESFHEQCQLPVTTDEPDPWFQMQCCGWEVNTSFWLGRKSAVIRHHHTISNESPIDLETQGAPVLLANALCWTGLSVLEWEHLTDDDVEPACATVIKVCGQFYDALPSLLKGIELSNITTM